MPPRTVQQAFALAFQHHQAGRLAEAAAMYRQILSVQPNHADALHLFGLIENGLGRREQALACIQRAVALDPHNAAAFSNLGEIFRGLGRADEAVAAYRRAIAVDPNFPEAYSNLGHVLRHQDKPEEAAAICRRALDLRPDFPEAWNNLGNALTDLQRLDEAGSAFQRALELQPRHAAAFYNLGLARHRQGRWEEAIAAYRQALALRPNEAAWHNDLGAALSDAGEWPESVVSLRRAIELMPDAGKPWSNLGRALMELGEFDDAMAAFRRALSLDPHCAFAQFGQAVLYLLRGNFAQGWPAYEARWETYRSPRREFPQPLWEDSQFDGRRLLIHAEQGYGDAHQFIRYAALAAARGAHVLVQCQPPLVELFRGARGVHQVVAKGDPLPPFDFHVPMLSLPLVFATTPETIPRDIPYLFADPSRRAEWVQRLGAEPRSLRVGLAWAGSAQHRRARIRDIPFARLPPLWSIEGIELFSLQVTSEGEGIRQPTPHPVLIDYTPELRDFSDTAAFLAELDLVISVDTAVAHLAGALGRPVWTLLPFVPDWRWGLASETTPWYPTMRLFRQPSLGDWDSVIRRVADELQTLVKRRNP